MKTIIALALLCGFFLAATSFAAETELKETDKTLPPLGGKWSFEPAINPNPSLPRVLLIGDSICIGYKANVIAALAGRANVDVWPHPLFQSEKLNQALTKILKHGPYDVVHVNLGLHGVAEGRILPGTYEPLTRQFIQIIRDTMPKVKIIWANTTQFTLKGKPTELDPVKHPTVLEHNRMAAKLMAELNIPVNDFYGLLIDKLELGRGDTVHWIPPAYKILGDKATASILLALSQKTAGSKKDESKSEAPADVRVERDVAYLPAGRTERADLYLPLETPKDARMPAVVWIHGGGWNGGQRDGKREINVCGTLARNGYFAMSIDYKLARTGGAVWPQNLADCKTAVRWLRKNADRFGIDPERIGVMGGSAGGHLAAMVALTTKEDGLDPAEPYGEFSCAVKCCVDMYGITDVAKYHDAKMLGKTIAEAPELYRRASPLTYVRSGSPPFLILHGTADTTVNIEQSKWLDAALTKAGVAHEFIIIPDAPHTFDLQPKQRDLRPVVLGFLDQHLKAPAPKANP